MDFRKLSDTTLVEFGLNYLTQLPPGTLFQNMMEHRDENRRMRDEGYQTSREQFIQDIQSIYENLPESEKTVEKLPVEFVDLHIATQVQSLMEQNPSSRQTYLESRMLNIQFPIIFQFVQQLNVPHSSEITLSEEEFLRERVIRILKFAGLLKEDVLSQDEPHVSVYPAFVPPHRYPGVTAEDYFELDQLQELEQIRQYYYPELETIQGQEDFILENFPDRLMANLQEREFQIKEGDIIEDEDNPDIRLQYLGDSQFGVLGGPEDPPIDPRFKHPDYPLGYFYNQVSGEWTYDGGIESDVDPTQIEWIDISEVSEELKSNLRGPFLHPAESYRGLTPLPLSPEHIDKAVFRTYLYDKNRKKYYNFELPARNLEKAQDKISGSQGAVGLNEDGYFQFDSFWNTNI